eukprot:4404517-Prymnesium_polylepis.1
MRLLSVWQRVVRDDSSVEPSPSGLRFAFWLLVATNTLVEVIAEDCLTVWPSDFRADLSQATLIHSNLGGLGASGGAGEESDGSAHAGFPPTLRLGNIGTNTITGQTIDLILSNNSNYMAWKTSKNGLTDDGLMGAINLESPHSGVTGTDFNMLDLNFDFVDSVTSAPVVLSRLHSEAPPFKPEPEGSSGNGKECITTRGYDEMRISNTTQISIGTDPLDTSFDAFCSTEQGYGYDNPSDPADLTRYFECARPLLHWVRQAYAQHADAWLFCVAIICVHV